MAGHWLFACLQSALTVPQSYNCQAVTPPPTITSTPPPTNTPRPTSTSTFTPTPQMCIITTLKASPIYRGPSYDDLIWGNGVAAGQQVTITSKATDETSNNWYGFLDNSRGTGVITWTPVIDKTPGQTGPVINEGQFSGCPGLANGNTLPNPVSPNFAWNFILGTQVPQQPIQSNKLATGVPSFQGFGAIDASNYGSITGCRHPGFDFQVAPQSNVFAMTDGIVVGMGTTLDSKNMLRPGTWGSVTDPKDSNALPEFNLVIRDGAHFILYGHLGSIEPSLYYGKSVRIGDVIGVVVILAANTHLHVEVDAFHIGQNIDASVRPRFGAIIRSGLNSENPSRITDLMAFVSPANRGSTVFMTSPTPDCQQVNTSSNTRYQGAQFANPTASATIVYYSRDREHNQCFDEKSNTNLYSPTQYASSRPSTALAMSSPTPLLIPTATP